MERLMNKKHTKYMYNKHTQRNNINLHAMECFFTNIYKNVRQSLYLNEIEWYENTKYMHNKHTSILQE